MWHPLISTHYVYFVFSFQYSVFCILSYLSCVLYFLSCIPYVLSTGVNIGVNNTTLFIASQDILHITLHYVTLLILLSSTDIGEGVKILQWGRGTSPDHFHFSKGGRDHLFDFYGAGLSTQIWHI